MSRRTTRRDLLKQTSAASLGLWLASRPGPAWSRSRSPSDKLNIAKIGCANQGESDLNDVSGENIVALCDVDEALAAKAFQKFDRAARFNDYRRMFDKMAGDIDAVVISTPDHMHAPISLAAMELGKHVYTQKPLTHTVAEARRLADAARKYKNVVTQMGNQGHSNEGSRVSVEIIRSGALGHIQEIYAWTDRPIGFWDQGIDRPADTPEVPKTLQWDLWLGVAPRRPYHPAYLPSKWRGWWDFGTGSMGDMACHVCDVAFWALDLRDPVAVSSEVSGVHQETAPLWAKITWEFPALPGRPPLKMHWYDGKKLPPAELFEGEPIVGNGMILIGQKGKLYVNDAYGATRVLLPKKQFEGFKPPPPTLPRVPAGLNHHQVWIQACKDGKADRALMSHFEYAAAMTETLLLGNLSVRAGGKRLEWDAKQRKVTNLPDANAWLDPPYRTDW